MSFRCRRNREYPALSYLSFCCSDPAGLMVFRLTVPQSAPGSTPPLGSGPRPLTPTGPQVPSGGGGPCRLGRPLINAPQDV